MIPRRWGALFALVGICVAIFGTIIPPAVVFRREVIASAEADKDCADPRVANAVAMAWAGRHNGSKPYRSMLAARIYGDRVGSGIYQRRSERFLLATAGSPFVSDLQVAAAICHEGNAGGRSANLAAIARMTGGEIPTASSDCRLQALAENLVVDLGHAKPKDEIVKLYRARISGCAAA